MSVEIETTVTPAALAVGDYVLGVETGTPDVLARYIDSIFGKTASPLSQFAATTSAQLAGVISDETGTGSLVFATNPILVTPNLGTPSAGVLTNCTGYPYSALTGAPSIPTGANPTAKVGAAVVNGSAATFMRSDAAPPIDLTFTPNWTGAHTWTPTQAANTSVDGIVLADTTAASSGNQQYSPRLRLTGQGWKTVSTAGSQTVDWIVENLPVQGSANPSANLVFSYQINGAGFVKAATITSNGGVIANDWGQVGGTVLIGDSHGSGFGYNSHPVVILGGTGSVLSYAGGSTVIRDQICLPQPGFGPEATVVDTCIRRNATSVAEINNGTAGQFANLISGSYNATSTGTVVNGLQTSRHLGAAGAAGDGIGHLFTIDDSTTVSVSAGQITTEWVVATHASRTARLKLWAFDTAAREGIRVEATGSAALVGIGGAVSANSNLLMVNGTLEMAGNVKLGAVGNKLFVKEGTNASMGVGTLSTGTATISNTNVTANSRIFLSDQGGGTLANIGSLSVGTITPGTSFVVNSSNGLDSSNFAYLIIEPA